MTTSETLNITENTSTSEFTKAFSHLLERPSEDLIKSTLEAHSKDYDSAFYVCELSKLVAKVNEWRTNLPRVKPHYAVKCNPNSTIVRALALMGVSFDCASMPEIKQVMDMNVSADRIIYANPCKMVSHIKYARSVGVERMTFDNIPEIDKIAASFPGAKCLLRIITDDSESVCAFSSKFGAHLDTTKKILTHARAKGVEVIGVSFHVGSGCMSTRAFVNAIENAAVVFGEGKELGFNMSVLDIGGGFPGNNDEISFPAIAKAINASIDALFPDTEIIAEPGRYFAQSCFSMCMQVFGKRQIDSADGKSFLYYANDGVYQSFNCRVFDHYDPAPIPLVNEKREKHVSTIFGPTCDSMDCVAKNIQLEEVHVGEWLMFKNMGAYTFAASSNFNGFAAQPEIYYYY